MQPTCTMEDDQQSEGQFFSEKTDFDDDDDSSHSQKRILDNALDNSVRYAMSCYQNYTGTRAALLRLMQADPENRNLQKMYNADLHDVVGMGDDTKDQSAMLNLKHAEGWDAMQLSAHCTGEQTDMYTTDLSYFSGQMPRCGSPHYWGPV